MTLHLIRKPLEMDRFAQSDDEAAYGVWVRPTVSDAQLERVRLDLNLLLLRQAYGTPVDWR